MSAPIPPPPIPPTPQDPASSAHPPPSKRQRLHLSPSPGDSISQKDSNLSRIENQRRELTKGIIENLRRDELEEILLEAALQNEEIMRSVIRVNGSSHGKALSEDMPQDGSARKRRSRRVDGDGVEGGRGGEEDGRVMEEGDGRGLGMDRLRGVDGGGPMQFHHVTRNQFEARMVRIREKGFEAEEVYWDAR